MLGTRSFGLGPVRLYRQSRWRVEVNVMFELVGAGQATIEEVQLHDYGVAVAEPSVVRRCDRSRPSRIPS